MLIEEFEYTPHIRSRGEEKRQLNKGCRECPRRWLMERLHRWLNRSRGILIRRGQEGTATDFAFATNGRFKCR
jgi:putative transposase